MLIRTRRKPCAGANPVHSAMWSVVRTGEGARLECVCAARHSGFESQALRHAEGMAAGLSSCPESSTPWKRDARVRVPHPPPSSDGIAVGMRKRLESVWSQRCGSGVRFPLHPPHGDHSTTVSASGCGPGHRGSTPRGHTMRPRSSTDERRPPKSQTCWFESSRGHHMRVSTNGRVGDQQSPNPGSTPGTRTIDWGLAQR